MGKHKATEDNGMKISEMITLFVLIWASLSIYAGEIAIPFEYVFKGIADPDRTILDYFIEEIDVQ